MSSRQIALPPGLHDMEIDTVTGCPRDLHDGIAGLQAMKYMAPHRFTVATYDNHIRSTPWASLDPAGTVRQDRLIATV